MNKFHKESSHNYSYSKEFFSNLEKGSYESAKRIIPYVLRYISPNSVVDIGCGVGTWLHVFNKYKISNFLGIDGSYIDEKMLMIPKRKFLSFDLTKSLKVNKKFDLVVSLEVAEHIAPKYAVRFIQSLVNLGPIVLFSAAIPYQGGVNHLNEQWLEYWEKLFKKHGYIPIDCIRRKIWNNPEIEWWYKQNILFYIQKKKLNLYPVLKKEYMQRSDSILTVVHPKCYQQVIDNFPRSFRNLLKRLAFEMLDRLNVRKIRNPISFSSL